MPEYLTWETFLAFLTVGGVIVGISRWIHTAFSKQAKDLQDYKLHVAETYATKEGVEREFLNVTKSINELGARMETRLDGMNSRLDRVIETRKGGDQ